MFLGHIVYSVRSSAVTDRPHYIVSLKI